MLRRQLTLACALFSLISLSAILRADSTVQVAQGSGTLIAPGYYKQDYEISYIDTTRFPHGGTLQIKIQMGSGVSSGSFDVFPQDATVPTDGPPTGTLGGAYDISPGSTAQITIQFAKGKIFKFGATGNWFSQVGTTNSYSFTAYVITPTLDVAISRPYNGAVPQSNYVALTGTGSVGSTIAVLVDDSTDASKTAHVDADGGWEKLVYAGPGPHTLAVENAANTEDVSIPISVVTAPLSDTHLGSTTQQAITTLQIADIFLAKTTSSIETKLYGPNYTHTALYLGGDDQGTPIVAEALPDWLFVNEGGVRTAPIEASSIGLADTVDVYRPVIQVSKSRKISIVNLAYAFIAKHPSYWFTDEQGFWPLRQALGFWDFKKDQPLANRSAQFNKVLEQLDMNKNATDRFICSTLVWHCYLLGTNGTLDLSTPNNASLKGGWAEQYGLVDDALNRALQPHFVFPDTLALSGKLQKVN